MISFVIGQNAIGKTLFIKSKIKELLDISQNADIITNLYDIDYKNIGYDAERLDILQDITEADSIDTSNEILNILGYPVKLGIGFLKIINMLCKNYKIAYLDEPEQGLKEHEIYLLTSFLERASRTYNDIIIVTHSELLIQALNSKCITVKMDDTTTDLEISIVPEDKKFEIID